VIFVTAPVVPVLPYLKSKFLIFVIKISLNSLDCICYFLENSLKFHEAVCSDFVAIQRI
jgi:hypothetical protein